MPKLAPKIDDARVHELAAAGLSQREIAARLGVSHVAIGNRLRARPVTDTPAAPPTPDVPLRGRLVAVVDLLRDVGGLEAHIETIHEAIAQLDVPHAVELPEVEPDEPEPDEPADHLTRCRSLYARSLKLASSAERLGNVTAAQRAMRDSASLAVLIARVERTARDDQDVLRISRAEIDEAHRALLERKKILCQRPLLCADCGRKLSIRWAFDGDPPAETVEGGQ